MKSTLRPVALLAIGLLVVTACQPSASGSPADSGSAASAGGSSGELTGEVRVSGSSTVLPISNLVFEAFAGMHSEVTGFVDGPGTGDGFALFCNDEIDVADASRPISEEEVGQLRRSRRGVCRAENRDRWHRGHHIGP